MVTTAPPRASRDIFGESNSISPVFLLTEDDHEMFWGKVMESSRTGEHFLH